MNTRTVATTAMILFFSVFLLVGAGCGRTRAPQVNSEENSKKTFSEGKTTEPIQKQPEHVRGEAFQRALSKGQKTENCMQPADGASLIVTEEDLDVSSWKMFSSPVLPVTFHYPRSFAASEYSSGDVYGGVTLKKDCAGAASIKMMALKLSSAPEHPEGGDDPITKDMLLAYQKELKEGHGEDIQDINGITTKRYIGYNVPGATAVAFAVFFIDDVFVQMSLPLPGFDPIGWPQDRERSASFIKKLEADIGPQDARARIQLLHAITDTMQRRAPVERETFTDTILGLQFDYPKGWGPVVAVEKNGQRLLSFNGMSDGVVLNAFEAEIPNSHRAIPLGDQDVSLSSDDDVRKYCFHKSGCSYVVNQHDVFMGTHVIQRRMPAENSQQDRYYFFHNPSSSYPGIVVSPIQVAESHDIPYFDILFDSFVLSIRFTE